MARRGKKNIAPKSAYGQKFFHAVSLLSPTYVRNCGGGKRWKNGMLIFVSINRPETDQRLAHNALPKRPFSFRKVDKGNRIYPCYMHTIRRKSLAWEKLVASAREIRQFMRFLWQVIWIYFSLFLAPTLEFSRESGFAEFATKISEICGKGNISY